MSVASKFPPEVVIPERARRTMPGGRGQARHLTLVSGPSTTGEPSAAIDQRGATGYRMPGLAAEPLRFGESRLDWPLSVPPTARPMRLTRRGLVVAIVATMLLAALLLTVARLSAGTAASAPAAPAGSSVTVQPGDTLWSIAQRTQPKSDPRLVVDHLRKVNHLNSVVLSPGQTLKVG
jgi:LysM repeat protein